MAVKFSPGLLLVSLHRPHSRLAVSEFTATLEELTELFTLWKSMKVIIGMDANTRSAGINDCYCVGRSVPDCSLNGWTDGENRLFYTNSW